MTDPLKQSDKRDALREKISELLRTLSIEDGDVDGVTDGLVMVIESAVKATLEAVQTLASTPSHERQFYCQAGGCETQCENCAQESPASVPSTTPQKLSEPHEPPMVYDPMQGMVRPGGIRALMNDLRKLYDKTAEAHDGDYPEKVDHGLVAVYAYGRRQTTPSATPLKMEVGPQPNRYVSYLIDGKPHRVCDCDPHKGPCAKGFERTLLTCELSRCFIPAPDILICAADGGKQT